VGCSGTLRSFTIDIHVVFLNVLDDLLLFVNNTSLFKLKRWSRVKNVGTYRIRNEIPDAHIFAKKGPDFRAADVVLDSLVTRQPRDLERNLKSPYLMYDMDVCSPIGLQPRHDIVQVCSCSLDDECTNYGCVSSIHNCGHLQRTITKNMSQVLRCPNTRLTKSLDEVSTS
jgi:hypothetical protein